MTQPDWNRIGPQLLAALQLIDREMGGAASKGASGRPTIKSLNCMWDAARAAIAKAKEAAQ